MKLKILKKIILTILISFSFWSLTSTIIENVNIKKQITEFKKKGVYSNELSDSENKVYKVSRETWQENKEYSTDGRIGSSGDIIVGLESALKGYPIITDFITFFFGGHASLCAYDYDDYQTSISDTDAFEADGFVPGDTYTPGDRYFWNDVDYRDEVIGLRVKTTEEKRKTAFSKAVENSKDPYNKKFIFDTKTSHYCTDFISKAYDYAGVNLNYDGFACTVQDLIYSDDTYIFFYKKNVKGINYIYYLD